MTDPNKKAELDALLARAEKLSQEMAAQETRSTRADDKREYVTRDVFNSVSVAEKARLLRDGVVIVD